MLAHGLAGSVKTKFAHGVVGYGLSSVDSCEAGQRHEKPAGNPDTPRRVREPSMTARDRAFSSGALPRLVALEVPDLDEVAMRAGALEGLPMSGFGGVAVGEAPSEKPPCALGHVLGMARGVVPCDGGLP